MRSAPPITSVPHIVNAQKIKYDEILNLQKKLKKVEIQKKGLKLLYIVNEKEEFVHIEKDADANAA